ncbi:hypothetical protein [Holospora elegans]|nr:hypothetical protein [Holospora elegans]
MKKKIVSFLFLFAVSSCFSLTFSNDEEEKSLEKFSKSLEEFTKGKSIVASVKDINSKFFLDKIKEVMGEEVSFLENILNSGDFQCVNEQYFMDPFHVIPITEKRCIELGKKIDALKNETFFLTIKREYESILEKREKFIKLKSEENQFCFKSEFNVLLDQKKESKKIVSKFPGMYLKYLEKRRDSLNVIMVLSMPFLNEKNYQLVEPLGYCEAFAKYAVVHGYEETLKKVDLLVKELSNDDLPVLYKFMQDLASTQHGVKFVSDNQFVLLGDNFQENFKEVRRKLCFGTSWLMPVATHIFQYIKDLNETEDSSHFDEQFDDSSSKIFFNKKNGIIVNFTPLFCGASLFFGVELSGHSIAFVKEEDGYIGLIDGTRSLSKEDIVFSLNPELIAENLEKAIKRSYFFIPIGIPSWEFTCEELR